MARVYLTDVQREAVRAGARNRWLGAQETGVQGSTMTALERKGMALARWTTQPYRRLIYRLTDAGVEERRRLAAVELDALHPPAVSAGVRCRCEHCGAVWLDATPGGSCGTCGQAVAAL